MDRVKAANLQEQILLRQPTSDFFPVKRFLTLYQTRNRAQDKPEEPAPKRDESDPGESGQYWKTAKQQGRWALRVAGEDPESST